MLSRDLYHRNLPRDLPVASTYLKLPGGRRYLICFSAGSHKLRGLFRKATKKVAEVFFKAFVSSTRGSEIFFGEPLHLRAYSPEPTPYKGLPQLGSSACSMSGVMGSGMKSWELRFRVWSLGLGFLSQRTTARAWAANLAL